MNIEIFIFFSNSANIDIIDINRQKLPLPVYITAYIQGCVSDFSQSDYIGIKKG